MLGSPSFKLGGARRPVVAHGVAQIQMRRWTVWNQAAGLRIHHSDFMSFISDCTTGSVLLVECSCKEDETATGSTFVPITMILGNDGAIVSAGTGQPENKYYPVHLPIGRPYWHVDRRKGVTSRHVPAITQSPFG